MIDVLLNGKQFKTDEDKYTAKKALLKLEAAVNKLVEETGLSEEKLAELFILKQD
ncbi:hypothetical protein BH24DEI2_BH24DEI2_14390 [soil metagenome]